MQIEESLAVPGAVAMQVDSVEGPIQADRTLSDQEVTQELWRQFETAFSTLELLLQGPASSSSTLKEDYSMGDEEEGDFEKKYNDDFEKKYDDLMNPLTQILFPNTTSSVSEERLLQEIQRIQQERTQEDHSGSTPYISAPTDIEDQLDHLKTYMSLPNLYVDNFDESIITYIQDLKQKYQDLQTGFDQINQVYSDIQENNFGQWVLGVIRKLNEQYEKCHNQILHFRNEVHKINNSNKEYEKAIDKLKAERRHWSQQHSTFNTLHKNYNLLLQMLPTILQIPETNQVFSGEEDILEHKLYQTICDRITKLMQEHKMMQNEYNKLKSLDDKLEMFNFGSFIQAHLERQQAQIDICTTDLQNVETQLDALSLRFALILTKNDFGHVLTDFLDQKQERLEACTTELNEVEGQLNTLNVRWSLNLDKTNLESGLRTYVDHFLEPLQVQFPNVEPQNLAAAVEQQMEDLESKQHQMTDEIYAMHMEKNQIQNQYRKLSHIDPSMNLNNFGDLMLHHYGTYSKLKREYNRLKEVFSSLTEDNLSNYLLQSIDTQSAEIKKIKDNLNHHLKVLTHSIPFLRFNEDNFSTLLVQTFRAKSNRDMEMNTEMTVEMNTAYIHLQSLKNHFRHLNLPDDQFSERLIQVLDTGQNELKALQADGSLWDQCKDELHMLQERYPDLALTQDQWSQPLIDHIQSQATELVTLRANRVRLNELQAQVQTLKEHYPQVSFTPDQLSEPLIDWFDNQQRKWEADHAHLEQFQAHWRTLQKHYPDLTLEQFSQMLIQRLDQLIQDLQSEKNRCDQTLQTLNARFPELKLTRDQLSEPLIDWYEGQQTKWEADHAQLELFQVHWQGLQKYDSDLTQDQFSQTLIQRLNQLQSQKNRWDQALQTLNTQFPELKLTQDQFSQPLIDWMKERLADLETLKSDRAHLDSFEHHFQALKNQYVDLTPENLSQNLLQDRAHFDTTVQTLNKIYPQLKLTRDTFSQTLIPFIHQQRSHLNRFEAALQALQMQCPNLGLTREHLSQPLIDWIQNQETELENLRVDRTYLNHFRERLETLKLTYENVTEYNWDTVLTQIQDTFKTKLERLQIAYQTYVNPKIILKITNFDNPLIQYMKEVYGQLKTLQNQWEIPGTYRDFGSNLQRVLQEKETNLRDLQNIAEKQNNLLQYIQQKLVARYPQRTLPESLELCVTDLAVYDKERKYIQQLFPNVDASNYATDTESQWIHYIRTRAVVPTIEEPDPPAAILSSESVIELNATTELKRILLRKFQLRNTVQDSLNTILEALQAELQQVKQELLDKNEVDLQQIKRTLIYHFQLQDTTVYDSIDTIVESLQVQIDTRYKQELQDQQALSQAESQLFKQELQDQQAESQQFKRNLIDHFQLPQVNKHSSWESLLEVLQKPIHTLAKHPQSHVRQELQNMRDQLALLDPVNNWRIARPFDETNFGQILKEVIETYYQKDNIFQYQYELIKPFLPGEFQLNSFGQQLADRFQSIQKDLKTLSCVTGQTLTPENFQSVLSMTFRNLKRQILQLEKRLKVKTATALTQRVQKKCDGLEVEARNQDQAMDSQQETRKRDRQEKSISKVLILDSGTYVPEELYLKHITPTLTQNNESILESLFYQLYKKYFKMQYDILRHQEPLQISAMLDHIHYLKTTLQEGQTTQERVLYSFIIQQLNVLEKHESPHYVSPSFDTCHQFLEVCMLQTIHYLQTLVHNEEEIDMDNEEL